MAKPKKKNKAKKKKKNLKSQIFLILGVVMGAVFLPSTFLIMIGMIPTPFALFVDKTKGKSKVLTVGSMNLAGCSPFLFELWTIDHSFAKSFEIVTDPFAIIVMWSAALVGYVINWAMTGIVAVTLYQRGQARQKSIVKRQEDLVKRWGKEVAGDLPLDEDGFPIEEGNSGA